LHAVGESVEPIERFLGQDLEEHDGIAQIASCVRKTGFLSMFFARFIVPGKCFVGIRRAIRLLPRKCISISAGGASATPQDAFGKHRACADKLLPRGIIWRARRHVALPTRRRL